MNMQTVEMVAYGSTFSTRERARSVAAKIQFDQSQTDVVINFAGVRAISYSFADEFLRAINEVMERQHLGTVTLSGTGSAVQDVLRQILERRQVANRRAHGVTRHEDTTILIGAA